MQYPQSVTFSQCYWCSMVTIQVPVMLCSGIVLLLLAAMLGLVLTMYTLSSVFNLGL